jgi:hypothetical protein
VIGYVIGMPEASHRMISRLFALKKPGKKNNPQKEEEGGVGSKTTYSGEFLFQSKTMNRPFDSIYHIEITAAPNPLIRE